VFKFGVPRNSSRAFRGAQPRCSLGLFAGASAASASDFPQAEISNGQITAKLYLPDATNGYYRSTRFDWSGAIYSLPYQGHDFYGPWFDQIDPKVINWEHQGSNIVSGPCSALMGPADEFERVPGWLILKLVKLAAAS
jgi:hypothetical protein